MNRRIINFLLIFGVINVVVNGFSLSAPPLSNVGHERKIDQDPEIWMSCDDVIRRWDYPVEQYDVTTDDGYILTIFRIPHGRNQSTDVESNEQREVVLFQHGLESSSYDWVANLPNEAAAFVFADNGFDVWLGNFRGNMYGKRHVSLSPKQREFWSFSWDEMAEHDLPTIVNKILDVSKVPSIYYVGHSMGTMTAFAKFSYDKEFEKKIKTFYALAPVTTVRHIKGPLKWLAPFTAMADTFFKLVGYNEFLPSTELTEFFAATFCHDPLTNLLCDDVAALLCGPESNQLNDSRVPVYVAHTPAGTSTQNVAHFGQMVNSGKFDKYSYGRYENKKHYGQHTPPVYDVTQIDVPIYLFWGDSDWLADPKDVENLIPQLRNMVGNDYLHDFNHLDFVWGLRASAEIYWPIMRDIRQQYVADSAAVQSNVTGNA